MSAALQSPPTSLHRGEEDLPFVSFGDGVALQLLQIYLSEGLWVVRQRMQPGVTLPTHHHTGSVNAFTLAGAWKYLEYPQVNVAGSYLFEPAGSVHTLHTPPSNTGLTDVWFAIHGANLNLDQEGRVYEIFDAARVLRIYLSRCFKAGLGPPAVIGAEAEAAAYWRAKGAAAA